MVVEDYAQKWSEVLAILRTEISEDEYKHWFGNVTFVSLGDGAERTLILSVPTMFLQGWIKENYLKLLEDIAKEVFGPLRGVEIKLRAMGVPVKQTPPPPKPEEPKPQKVARKLDAERARTTMYTPPHVKPPKPARPSSPMVLTPEEDEPEVAPISPEELAAFEAILPRKDRGIHIDDIREAVCRHYRITELEILSERRARHVSLPRQVGMYLACNLTAVPLLGIGMNFYRDDTTVMYSIRKIAQLIKVNKTVRDSVMDLTHELLQKVR